MVLSNSWPDHESVVKPVPSLRVVVHLRAPILRSSFFTPLLGLAGLSLVLAGLAAWNPAGGRPSPNHSVEPGSSGLLPAPPPRLPTRIVYPYSVVPGGVAGPEDARKAAAADTSVARHYQGFDLGKAWMMDSSQPRLAHVSYRRGGAIFWTRRKVLIPRGERLLTDGTRFIRARCGNRIADVPEGETEPAGQAVSEQVLDHPILDNPEPEDLMPELWRLPALPKPEPVTIPAGQELLFFSTELQAGGLPPFGYLHVGGYLFSESPPQSPWSPGPLIPGVQILPEHLRWLDGDQPKQKDRVAEVPEPSALLPVAFALLAALPAARGAR